MQAWNNSFGNFAEQDLPLSMYDSENNLEPEDHFSDFAKLDN